MTERNNLIEQEDFLIKKLFYIHTLLCQGRVYLARYELEELLGIEPKKE